MRANLATLILITTIMQVSANTFAQQISLSVKDAPLNQVFDQIRDQSGYNFLFTASILKDAKPVTLKITNEELPVVLRKIFSGQPLEFSLDNKSVVVTEKQRTFLDKLTDFFTLPIDVRGTVTDSLGSPLAGASIKIKGTMRSFVADSNGAFSITNLKEDDVLEVHFIGYRTKEVLVKGITGNVTVTLYVETGRLDEVVINTGYQKIRQEQFTGVVQHIGSQTLQNQISPDILSRLESIGNGLNVDRATTDGRITIRGLSSISGPKDVLVVVDNFPYDGSIDNINPNDIESITLLKDAAAGSIWGTRAGNGVIVIITRRGRFNQELQLQANANSSILQKPNLYRLERMASSDYIDVESFLFEQGHFQSAYSDPARPGLTPVIETLYNGSLTQRQKEAQLEQWRNLDVRDDFNRLVYETGLNQQYNVQANGGNKRYNWLATAGYDHNKDNLAALYNRLTLRYALGLKLARNLNADLTINYANVQNKSGKTGYTSTTALNGTLYPYAQLADAQGDALPLVQNYRLSYLETLNIGLTDWKYYPLTDYLYNTDQTKLNNTNVNLGLNYQFSGLSIQMLYRIERQQSANEHFYDTQSYTARDMVNSYAQVSANTINYIIPPGGIRDMQNANMLAQNLRLQTNYDKHFGAHHLTVMAGAEQRSLQNESSGYRYYGVEASTLNVGVVDLTRRYPHYITGSSSYISGRQSLGLANNNYVSLYGNVGYGYKDTYYAYASARRDASNLFGVSTNNKWKPLWSVGLAWDVDNDIKWLKPSASLKLRASYGFSGNADPSHTGLTTISYLGISPYTQNTYASITRFYNPDLRWETVGTFNVGADFDVLKKRLDGSMDYYVKKGKDLFGFYPIDYTSGVGPIITRNVASMQGKGIDFRLQSHNLVGKGLQWNTVFNFSINHDKVTDYYDVATKGGDYIGTRTITGLVGKPVYAVFSYRYGGLDGQGNPLGYLNGQPSTDYAILTGSGSNLADLRYHGSALPTVFGNLMNRFSYKSVSLEIAISYKLGYYFRRNSIQYTTLVGSGLGHPDYALRWQKPGDENATLVPAFQYPLNTARNLFYQLSEVLVEPADHIRLQYISLSYQLGNKLKPVGIYDMRLMLNCSNIGLLWIKNSKNIDPDYYSVLQLQPSRTCSLGIQFKF